MAPPVDIRVEDDRPATYLNAARRNITDDMEVVVFLMASPKKDLYDQMKQLLCLELPIPSQGMLQRSVPSRTAWPTHTTTTTPDLIFQTTV